MAVRTHPTGEWSPPTREIGGSQLIRLVDESRHREAAVEMIHDEPTRACPAAAQELLEHTRRESQLVDLRSLGDPGSLAVAQEGAAPDPGPATLRSEPLAEQATATPAEAATTETARLSTAATTQRIAPRARRDRKGVASPRLLLGVRVLVLLCLGVLVVLGLGRLGVIDASVYLSLGL
jgi:hypothetical protein